MPVAAAKIAICLLIIASSAVAQVRITGDEVPSLKPFDDMMTAFLAEHQVPGSALAIARNGRLVYQRGFGLADVENKRPVQPDSLFRIASISKPVTAVAVLQLAQRGKLKLTDRITDLLALDIPAAPQGDPRWKQITIDHLLHHSAGFDRDKSFDPMFKSREFALEQRVSPPAGTKEIIACMIRRPLDFDPGRRYAYSNFGYCLLGRAIEKVSGQSYEDYVKQHVLKPVGVTAMRIGNTRTTAASEVRYYDRGKRVTDNLFASRAGEPAKVGAPYGAWHLEAMDSHGGWIASAPDLVRFSFIADGGASRDRNQSDASAVLSDASIALMFARPRLSASPDEPAALPPVFYGAGWSVRQVGPAKFNTWHNGGLAGTSTLLVRRHDGLTWAVLFNSDFAADKQWLASKIDGLMHQTAGTIKAWPGQD